MAGARYLLQQRMRFEIPTNTPASSLVMFPLAGVGINAVGIVSGTLEVIVYNRTVGTGVTLSVNVANMARASDGKLVTQDAGYVASVPITTSDSNTRLLTEELSAPIGSLLGAILAIETGGQAAAAEIELEVWLVARDT